MPRRQVVHDWPRLIRLTPRPSRSRLQPAVKKASAQRRALATVFKIEDDIHCEWQPGEYDSFDSAVAELRRLADLPWHAEPNVAPCKQWRDCGRKYVIIEYDKSCVPWKQIDRTEVLEVSASGIRWLI